jgi:hypothetical protein
MGIGLRLSNIASIEILTDNNLPEFKQWLQHNDALCVYHEWVSRMVDFTIP